MTDFQITPNYVLFVIVSVWVLAGALYVVTTPNIVRAAYALLATFFGIAVLYVTFHADFLAAVQVLIYVGGVNILIIFGVMLSEKMGKVPFRETSMNVFPAAVTCVLIGSALILGLTTYPWEQLTKPVGPTSAKIGEMFLTQYLLPFEVASVLLLAVLVGAIAVARKEVKGK